MTVDDAAVKGTLAAVRRWSTKGYALFVPVSPLCLVSVGRQLPDKSIIAMSIPCRNGSSTPLFMIRRKSLPKNPISYREKVRIVLAHEVPGPDGQTTEEVEVEPFTASDKQVAWVVKGILEVAMGEE